MSIRPAVAPAYVAPAGACDTHTHVFGPIAEFPLAAHANYEPPQASFELHASALQRIGMSYGVVVQPAPYGEDTRALLDALRRSQGDLRGVAVATEEISDEELRRLRDAGVCGLRFSEMRNPTGGGRYPGTFGTKHLSALAPRMRALGLHAQVWASCEDCVMLAEPIRATGIDLVYDHMACVDTGKGTRDAAFRRILDLLREDSIWVKLSVCRSNALAPDYEALRPFHDALLDANSERLLWGTDWPFVRMGDRAPDPAQLLDLFAHWTPDESLRRRILVDNPRRLYGFPASPLHTGLRHD